MFENSGWEQERQAKDRLQGARYESSINLQACTPTPHPHYPSLDVCLNLGWLWKSEKIPAGLDQCSSCGAAFMMCFVGWAPQMHTHTHPGRQSDVLCPTNETCQHGEASIPHCHRLPLAMDAILGMYAVIWRAPPSPSHPAPSNSPAKKAHSLLVVSDDARGGREMGFARGQVEQNRDLDLFGALPRHLFSLPPQPCSPEFRQPPCGGGGCHPGMASRINDSAKGRFFGGTVSFAGEY